MKNNRKNCLSLHGVRAFIILSIVVVAFLAYNDILHYFFTGMDSISEVDTGRIQSFSDVIRIFSEPGMNAIPDAKKVQRWYRPISVLSNSMDYSIWKLNPFGHHLTNLILHILVTLSVFFLVQNLTNGKQVTAWLGALIFTIHPVLVEGVPVPARRHDIIAVLFVVLSLLFFLKYFYSAFSKRHLLLFSVFFYVIALGGKEIAIILPFLIFTYVLISHFSNEESFKNRIVYVLKGFFPYFALTFVYLVLRIYILQGIGGYGAGPSGIVTTSQMLLEIGLNYFINLLYPVDFLRLDTLFSPFQTNFKQINFAIVLSTILIFLLFKGKAIFRMLTHNTKRGIKIFKVFTAIILILSLICILSYPLVSPFINHLIQQAYDGKGLYSLANEMDNIGTYPVETYFYKIRNIILELSLTLLFLSSICVAGIHHYEKIRKIFIDSTYGKLVIFLLIWLLLPLGIYLLTVISGRYYLYISVIPFSIILSILIVESFQFVVQKIRDDHLSVFSYRSLFFDGKVISFVVTTVLAISLLLYSPLLRTYGEWEASGNLSRMFFLRLTEIIPNLPTDAVLHIYNFPSGISSYETEIPHAKDATYLRGYGIKSWIDLNYPANHMKVIMESRTKLTSYPHNLDLEIRNEKDKNVVITIKFSDDSSYPAKFISQ